MSQRSALINVMVRAAEKAGRILVRDFGEVEQLQVSKKGPNDFVTSADLRSEQILVEELGRARPDFGFWLEEGGKLDEGKPARWIVDPLDGTKNFLHGVPIWSISIAAEREGDVIAGVIYEPLTDQVFWAEKGVGAFVNHQRLRVSARKQLGDGLFSCSAAGKAGKLQDADYATMQRVGTQTSGLRRIGSCALSLAYVAAGRFEGFWGRNMNTWDVAAGVLMVREAGGLVSALDEAGKPTGGNPMQAAQLAASNYHLHTPLQGLLRAPE